MKSPDIARRRVGAGGVRALGGALYEHCHVVRKRYLLADSADVSSDELVANCHILLLKQTVKRLGRSSSCLDFDGDYTPVLLNEKVNLAHGRVLLIVACLLSLRQWQCSFQGVLF